MTGACPWGAPVVVKTLSTAMEWIARNKLHISFFKNMPRSAAFIS